jgi:inosose dehydratase
MNHVMGTTKVGLNPLSWYLTVDGPHPELAPPLPEIFRQIAASGFGAVPLDPPATMTTAEFRALLEESGLVAAPGYFSAPFSQPEELSGTLARARRRAVQHAELGVNRIFLAEQFPEPPRVAAPAQGKGYQAERLNTLIKNLCTVAQAMVEEGVTPCLHQHVGTLIETPEETEKVLAEIDPSLLLLGADTGHLAWAGADPAEFIQRYSGRVGAVHLKDVRLEVAETGRAADEDYWKISSRHIWTEPGRGDVPFDAVLKALEGFDDWLIVEVDVPDQPTPAHTAAVSYEWCQAHLAHRPRKGPSQQ